MKEKLKNWIKCFYELIVLNEKTNILPKSAPWWLMVVVNFVTLIVAAIWFLIILILKEVFGVYLKLKHLFKSLLKEREA
jgi:hypothetical protein